MKPPPLLTVDFTLKSRQIQIRFGLPTANINTSSTQIKILIFCQFAAEPPSEKQNQKNLRSNRVFFSKFSPPAFTDNSKIRIIARE